MLQWSVTDLGGQQKKSEEQVAMEQQQTELNGGTRPQISITIRITRPEFVPCTSRARRLEPAARSMRTTCCFAE